MEPDNLSTDTKEMRDPMNEQDSRKSPAEPEQGGGKSNKNSGRRPILWAVCGAYLLYLAYQLLKDYFSGAAAETGSETICIIGGGAFVLIGLFLVVVALRQGFQIMRENAQEMARVDEEDRQAAEEARRLREAEDEEDDDLSPETDDDIPADETDGGRDLDRSDDRTE